MELRNYKKYGLSISFDNKNPGPFVFTDLQNLQVKKLREYFLYYL